MPEEQEEQQEEQKPEKKIDVAMAVLLILAALFIDLLDVLILLLDFVLIGFILSILSGVIKFVVFQLWFRAIGVKGIAVMATQIVGAIMEAIPAWDVLPFTTLEVIIVILIANSGVAEKITTAVPAAKALAK